MVRYTWVAAKCACPMYTESCGSSSWTSLPSRYQAVSRCTAEVWRRSWRARLAARPSILAQTGVLAQLLEGAFECVEKYLFAPSPNEKWRLCVMRTDALTASCCIVEENPSCRRTKRHETGLEELRVANRKERVGQIDVSVPQRQNLRRTQRSAVQQEKKRSYRRWLQAATVTLI